MAIQEVKKEGQTFKDQSPEKSPKFNGLWHSLTTFVSRNLELKEILDQTDLNKVSQLLEAIDQRGIVFSNPQEHNFPNERKGQLYSSTGPYNLEGDLVTVAVGFLFSTKDRKRRFNYPKVVILANGQQTSIGLAIESRNFAHNPYRGSVLFYPNQETRHRFDVFFLNQKGFEEVMHELMDYLPISQT